MRTGTPCMIALRDWEAKSFYPHVPHLGNSMETGGELLGVTDWIPAEVPGSIQRDLHRAGWIEDPYFGMNSLKSEWVENRWWMYRSFFELELSEGERAYATLRGIDYKGHVYLNQTYLGVHEGMFEPASYPVTELLRRGRNELTVLLEHAPDEMGQIGYTSRTKTQKSRFSYKWDFTTRIVPLGLWDDVAIEITRGARIRDVQVRPFLKAGVGEVFVRVNADAESPSAVVACRVTLYGGEATEAGIAATAVAPAVRNCIRDEGEHSFECALRLERPKLWYPNGSGSQPLYRVRVELLQEDGIVSDAWHGRTGFRQLEWTDNADAPEGALPYALRVNGQAVYIKGVNLTPLDALYGTVDRERYERVVRWLKRANVNLVRVWGGGLIEKEVFYDCCDEAGILIWQEFIQSSSGIDNIPSKDEGFLGLLERTAIHALKTKRNHVSLGCWSGGNELTNADGVPVADEDANIAMLKRLVERYDPGRRFFPSSASGPNEFLRIEEPGRNHDVHGPWKYGGPTGHYTVYNASDSLLHSEFGADGCCAYASMARFLPSRDLVVTSMKENATWRHHGEWWCTLDRDRELFGPFASLSQFVRASQWTQAEAIRYALEANRRRKFRNSGSIVWQFNEPFPNASCTSLVDYYGHPKMAYYAMLRSYAPKHASLRYESLLQRAGGTFRADVYLHNSLEAGELEWKAACFDAGGVVFTEEGGAANASQSSSILAGTLAAELPETLRGVFAVRLQVERQEPETYVFSVEEEAPFAEMLRAPVAILRWTMKDREAREGQAYERYEVENAGASVAWYVEAQADGGTIALFSPQQFAVLLPGERRIFELSYEARTGERPEIAFRCWNSGETPY
ncbi:hypothetical protein FE782_00745 [Paenibacillus antri]|uniref:beta-mannosidase n=1 Tax=Paenibacillus antri TaxID=2582848 RepID=A0A5R9GHH2_9BACL|nr:glycoside hydrolase family 2 TIM barrel-domain containing protein [Paenibacillus antri]TLS53916.1 hypothetical protein FE782_00745 [Paenibacillus antri]